MDGQIIESDPLTEGKHMTVAPWSGSLWTVYRLGGSLNGWQVGGGGFGSSSRWIDDQNRGKVPSYFIWNAMVGYFQPKWDVQFNVANILDKKYYVGGYQNNPNRVLPGQPVTGLLTLRYRFN
jgi:catecholate siderophore receptor